MMDIERAIEIKTREVSKLKSEIRIIDSRIKCLRKDTGDDGSLSNPIKTNKVQRSYPISDLIKKSSGFSVSGIKIEDNEYECAETDILLFAIRDLDKREPFVLEDLSLSDFCDGENHLLISLDPSRLHQPEEVRDGIFVESGLPLHECLEALLLVVREFSENPEKIQIQISC